MSDSADGGSLSRSSSPRNVDCRTTCRLASSINTVTETCNSCTSVGEVCRICHCGSESEQLLSPCYCNGTMGKFHISCLQRWLGSSNKSHCEICQFQFSVQRRSKPIIEYLRNPGTPRDKRNLICDLICIFLLTPLTSITVWLCFHSAKFLDNHAEERAGLYSLAGCLLIMFFCWLLICGKQNIKHWKNWKEFNQIVTLNCQPPIRAQQQSQQSNSPNSRKSSSGIELGKINYQLRNMPSPRENYSSKELSSAPKQATTQDIGLGSIGNLDSSNYEQIGIREGNGNIHLPSFLPKFDFKTTPKVNIEQETHRPQNMLTLRRCQRPYSCSTVCENKQYFNEQFQNLCQESSGEMSLDKSQNVYLNAQPYKNRIFSSNRSGTEHFDREKSSNHHFPSCSSNQRFDNSQKKSSLFPFKTNTHVYTTDNCSSSQRQNKYTLQTSPQERDTNNQTLVKYVHNAGELKCPIDGRFDESDQMNKGRQISQRERNNTKDSFSITQERSTNNQPLGRYGQIVHNAGTLKSATDGRFDESDQIHKGGHISEKERNYPKDSFSTQANNLESIQTKKYNTSKTSGNIVELQTDWESRDVDVALDADDCSENECIPVSKQQKNIKGNIKNQSPGQEATEINDSEGAGTLC